MEGLPLAGSPSFIRRRNRAGGPESLRAIPAAAAAASVKLRRTIIALCQRTQSRAAHCGAMLRNTNKPVLFPSAGTSSSSALPAANLAEMGKKIGLETVPAVWPTGMARLGTAISICERCDAAEVCRQWLARAPERLDRVPPFCPNADDLSKERAAKRV